MSKVRIGYTDQDGNGSTTATVITAKNHLLQIRQFAFDGRRWFYQPDTTGRFRQVNPREVPKIAVLLMAEQTGRTVEQLRNPDE
jgi:hypothetical protein